MSIAVEWLWSDVLLDYPDLKILLSEGDAGWIPYMMERADLVLDRHGPWTGQSRRRTGNGFRLDRLPVRKQRERRVERQDQAPEQHGARLASPERRKLVDRREVRACVRRDEPE